MVRCASVRKKGSLDPCDVAALKGHTLCGRHARCRVPVLWAERHATHGRGLEKLQGLIRGWLLRRRLALSGPGVLHRVNLANDEDVFTCESKDRQDPLDYFAFEEAGKTWWFGFASFWHWCSRTHDPVNPYTKVPLSVETRTRLWENWGVRLRSRVSLPEEPSTYTERLRYRWNVLSQLFSGFGFEDVHPMHFLDMSRTDYASMFILLKPDLEMLLPATDPTRERLLRICSYTARAAHTLQPPQYILQSTYTLLVLLALRRAPYSTAFSILSALLRC